MTFHQKHWFLKDLQYFYLDDGFTLVAYTDVPCHLFCRMTTTPPRRHAKPTTRRGLNVQWDIRFCFVVPEDNEQAEAGDTLIHTFVKPAWPVCETRWFYFVGSIAGNYSISESPIFKFHFPAPPPEPPPPLDRYFFGTSSNRTIRSRHVAWPTCWDGSELSVMTDYTAPSYAIRSGAFRTVRFGIWRAYLTFDTSALPDTSKIQSAQLLPYVYFFRRTSSAAFPYWQVTKGHQSDPVVIEDWHAQNPETTILGQIDYATLTAGLYNPIELNSAGLSHINLNGLTKYCLRAQLDIENQSPPLGQNDAWFYSQQKGAAYHPVLHVQYYPA